MAEAARRKKKPATNLAAHPVEALREQATALEAAMAVALAEPAKQPVHRLRVQTRRLEAQVMLLTQIEVLPEGSNEAKALTRGLRKLRRAAGRVRDLDVQGELLAEQLDLPREDAEQLSSHLLTVREKRAGKLQKVLERRVPEVAGALEHLVRSVQTANDTALPKVRLVEHIEQWKAKQTGTGSLPVELMDDDELHDARKTAKAARYMAESAPDSPEAKKAAHQYEAQQNAGGVWHDWADLAGSAKKFFGKKHALTQAAQQKCEGAKAEYLKLLQ